MNADELALWAGVQSQSEGPAMLPCQLTAPTTRVSLLPIPLHLPTLPTVATHKAGRVVIPQGLGIAKSLHSRISLDDLILEGTLVG